MSAPLRRRLVIDADVLRGAGRLGTRSDSGARRVAFLKAVFAICHRVTVPAKLQDEWRRHSSGEAREWYVYMWSKGKVEPVVLRHDAVLRERVLATAPTRNERAIMEKDWHLVLAALQSDGLIVSCERQARFHFGRAALDVAELRSLVWVDPHDPGACEWLREGAPTVPERCLGHQP